MIEHGRGFLIKLSSLASFAGNPAGMVYGASKAFLNIFSEGLQQEIAAQGIKVQSLCPGYTYSEFHDRETITHTGFSRDQVPQDIWMEVPTVVASSLFMHKGHGAHSHRENQQQDAEEPCRRGLEAGPKESGKL